MTGGVIGMTRKMGFLGLKRKRDSEVKRASTAALRLEVSGFKLNVGGWKLEFVGGAYYVGDT